MYWNYFKIALRNLRKHKLFATINILGLALGMTIYVFGFLLVEYEQTHDTFYENSDRTYLIGAIAAPELEVGINKMNTTFSAVAPVINVQIPDVEAVARTIGSEYLVTMGPDSFYQSVWFADETLLEIFNFDYIQGDATSLTDPTGIVITETAATKYFSSTDVIGEIITLDNQYDFHVTAVIEDLPLNSHFNSMPVQDSAMDVIAPLAALTRMRDFDINGEWDNWSLGNNTYVMLPAALDGEWLQRQMDSIYTSHVPDESKEIIDGFWVSQLTEANLILWDMLGLPVMTIISLLSFLVLVVACVNYTNLATAQSLGRSREVGMRKTMGAGRKQLLAQFLTESLVIAFLAMFVAIGALEILIPLFNGAANKVLALDYLRSLPWLVATAVLVGLCAGAYPAWLITNATPIEALRELARKGKKGSKVRAFMIGTQFAISAFMLSVVAIVFMQNKVIRESSNIFPRSEIYNLYRIGNDDITSRLETLRLELEAIPNVDSVAYTSQVPYEQNNSAIKASATPGDEAGEFMIQRLHMSPEFLDAYDISLLAGRNLSRDIAQDTYVEDETEFLNVIVNEMTAARLGYDNPADAINQRMYDNDPEGPLQEMVIVGVAPTQNIVGFFQSEKPWVYWYEPDGFRVASIRITQGDILDTIDDIESVWKRTIPDYPMQGRFLDDIFNDVYNILRYMNLALSIFAGVALSLALIGLFGLAAFMAAQRTKEIGVRKVLGASSIQIARLLVWQFSKPVMWGLVVALPAAFFASQMYLNFFGERMNSPIVVLLISGALAVLLAWGTVAGHVYRIARANPVLALRYE